LVLSGPELRSEVEEVTLPPAIRIDPPPSTGSVDVVSDPELHPELRRRTTSDPSRSNAMYDMYPEWGPAHLRQDTDAYASALQTSLDLRDNGGERPDDN
jgi:hypothetical protein